MADYLVRTDVYNGPLDLLLFLIKREEIDICDIPVAHVTKQYVEYIGMLRVIDPNVAGDFLVMAATLMEIKSRMLLPRQPSLDSDAEDLADPRLELVRQLLEYKSFKDASFALGAAAEVQAARWPRSPAKVKPAPPGEVDLDDAQIWDLVAAFNTLMTSIGVGPATHDVVFDDTPISLHATDIVDRLQAEGGQLSFEAIFHGRTKPEMIGLFLALLELMRQQRIRITQSTMFGEISIRLISAVPIEIGEEWESSFLSAVLGEDEATRQQESEETPDLDEGESNALPEANSGAMMDASPGPPATRPVGGDDSEPPADDRPGSEATEERE